MRGLISILFLLPSYPSLISIPRPHSSSPFLISIPHHHPSQVRANRHQCSSCQVGCVPRRRGKGIGQGSAGTESRRVCISVPILTIEFDGVVSSRVRASATLSFIAPYELDIARVSSRVCASATQYYRALHEIDIAHGISLISAPCAQRSLDDSSNLTGLDLQEWARLSHADCVLHTVYFSSLHSVRTSLSRSYSFSLLDHSLVHC
jgi:hypothetical protein